MLLNVQTDMANRNEQLNLIIGTLSKDYLESLKKENPLWHRRYLDLLKRVKRNRLNSIRPLNKLPKGKTEIKLNTKELQEILKAEDKTDCN